MEKYGQVLNGHFHFGLFFCHIEKYSYFVVINPLIKMISKWCVIVEESSIRCQSEGWLMQDNNMLSRKIDYLNI